MKKIFLNKAKSSVAGVALMAGAALSSQTAVAQGVSPLELAFYDLPGMSTANLLPQGALLGIAGQNMANPPTAAGTGNQLYYFGAEYGLTDRLQVGVTTSKFADPVTFGGSSNNMIVRSYSGNAAYQVYKSDTVSVAARGSIEYFSFSSQFHGTRGSGGGDHAIGSLHVPITVNLSDAFQVHVSPGVSFFPDNLNGVPFYGTVFQLGAGATYRASDRFTFFGSVNAPFGDGGNTIDRATGAPKNVPVWTAGARFMASPTTAIDLYATNGFGMTPATEILTFYPEGDEILIGARLTFTPGLGDKYRKNFRGIRAAEVTDRERHLQLRGITMASADTLEAGTALLTGAYGNNGQYNASARVSLNHDLEFGYFVENLENDGSRGAGRRLGSSDEFRWGVKGKLRLLDQNNGSPFSLSLNAELGREFNTRFGAAYVSAPMSYKVSPRFALMAEPKAAAFANDTLFGLALGANAELFDGVELMAEASAFSDGADPVWAVGARYHLDDIGMTGASIELQATNAAGNFGAASMLAQDDVRFGLGLNLALDGRKILGGLF